jgi:hypothetical protein
VSLVSLDLPGLIGRMTRTHFAFPSTLLRSIHCAQLTTFPGLTTNLIREHSPKTVVATALGHQDQEDKHLRSTKIPIPDTISQNLLDGPCTTI